MAHIVEKLLQSGSLFCELPDSEIVACGGNKIWTVALFVWDEHDLGSWVGMLELKLAIRAESASFIIHCRKETIRFGYKSDNEATEQLWLRYMAVSL